MPHSFSSESSVDLASSYQQRSLSRRDLRCLDRTEPSPTSKALMSTPAMAPSIGPRRKTRGYQFAFVKATEGVNFIDSRFTTNMNGAHNAGVLVGPYHFTRHRK